ncbi:MAG: 50S ribosomal protein L24 [Anaerolineae bacterium]|nr:50S ribosomal protein L24 [Thermoflexales bacterium]MDW8395561.1 50S ribosomal protein L24 [Anaerolineae bacterium]
MKIKKGDTVLVIAGDSKGKRGEVIKVLPKKNKVVVKGVNIAKKHARPRQAGRRVAQAGLIEVEMPIDASNVKLIAPNGTPTRVNYRFVDGRKVRYSNKLDEVLD